MLDSPERSEAWPYVAVGLDHAADEPLQSSAEGEASAEFRGRDPQHGTQVAPETLRRGILQPVCDVGH